MNKKEESDLRILFYKTSKIIVFRGGNLKRDHIQNLVVHNTYNFILFHMLNSFFLLLSSLFFIYHPEIESNEISLT